MATAEDVLKRVEAIQHNYGVDLNVVSYSGKLVILLGQHPLFEVTSVPEALANTMAKIPGLGERRWAQALALLEVFEAGLVAGEQLCIH